MSTDTEDDLDIESPRQRPTNNHRVNGAPVVSNETIITEIQLVKDALAGDYFATRDPNVAALLLCLKQQMVRHRVMQVRYGNRSPQRVVEFEFAGHEQTFRQAVNCLMDIRSSLDIKNINIGEFLAHLRNVKTIILSCV